MSKAKKTKGTLERVTEPVSDAAGAVVKSVKRTAPKVTREIGSVMHSINEVVSDGVDVVKDIGSRAIEGVSHMLPGATKPGKSRPSARKKPSDAKSKASSAARGASSVKKQGASAKPSPASSKTSKVKVSAKAPKSKSSPVGKPKKARAAAAPRKAKSSTTRRVSAK